MATSKTIGPLIVACSASAAKQQASEAFPLKFWPLGDTLTSADTLNWLAENRVMLLDSLSRHGALVFRGFPLENVQAFDDFITVFQLQNFPYKESLSNAVRRNRTERIFTANEAPPAVEIYLHHEMAQTPVFPAKLFFFCEQECETGGQTPLCRSDLLANQLQSELADFFVKCKTLGVKYSNTMPWQEDRESGQGRSWCSTLGTEDKSVAESKLKSLNYQWQWQADSSLRVTSPTLAAVRQTGDGRQVFFNQLIAAFRGWKTANGEKSLCFGNDSEIPAASMVKVIELADGLTYDHQWKKGDVALIDNFLVMHGRRPYRGQRSLLASLTAN